MSTFVQHAGLKMYIIVLLLMAVSAVAFATTTYATGTGTVTGKVWMDDTGNDHLCRVSTDSNSVEDSGEWFSGQVKVFVTDSNGLKVAWSNSNTGVWSATVSTLTPVTVTVDATSLNIPSNFDPTTPITHTVNVAGGSTVTIPSFGFGPPCS